MKLYNKSGRSFIIAASNVLSGGRFQQGDMVKDRAYLDPEQSIEVRDETGEKLCRDYPKAIMNVTGGHSNAPARKRAPAKKKVVTVKKEIVPAKKKAVARKR